MALRKSTAKIDLTKVTGQNWEESYITVIPFTIREVREYSDKLNSLQNKKDNEDKIFDLLSKVLKERFVDCKIYDEDEKQLVDVDFETLESEILTVSILRSVISFLSGSEEEGKKKA